MCVFYVGAPEVSTSSVQRYKQYHFIIHGCLPYIKYGAVIKIRGRWLSASGLMKTNVSFLVMVVTHLNNIQLKENETEKNGTLNDILKKILLTAPDGDENQCKFESDESKTSEFSTKLSYSKMKQKENDTLNDISFFQ